MASFERPIYEPGVHSLEEDTQTLIPNLPESSCQQTAVKFILYKRRWYIVVLYCVISILQSLIGNIWSPIQATASAVYKWEAYMIDLLSAFQPICYCIAMPLFAWLMDVKGLRISMIVAAGFQCFGSVLRCIPIDNLTFTTALINCGQILSSFAGPMALAMPPLLSSTWFPPYQRTTATAIVIMSAYAGDAIAFILSPAFVDDVSLLNLTKVEGNYVLNKTLRAHYHHQINELLYTEAGIMFGLFLAVLLYFPAKPPTPPSPSAGKRRVEFKSGFRRLLTNCNFLLLVCAYSISTAFFGGLMMVLDQCLSEFAVPVSQKFAGWLGFVCVISGSISGIIFSVLADHFFGYLKLFLIFAMAFSFYTVLLISYVFMKVIAFNKTAVYVLFALSGFFLNSSIPLFFELGVEIAYPVGEGTAASLITISNNIIQSLFFVVPLAHLGTKWMIWANVSVFFASTLIVFFVKDTYKRSTDEKSLLH